MIDLEEDIVWEALRSVPVPLLVVEHRPHPATGQPTWRLAFANRSMEVALDVRLEDVRGATAEELLPAVTAEWQRLHSLVAESPSWEESGCHRFRLRLGERHYEARALPMRSPRCLVSLCDVTDRAAAEEALAETEARFRLLLQLSEDAIALIDGDRLVAINAAFANLFRLPDISSTVGRTVADFLLPERRWTVAERVGRMLSERGRVDLAEETLVRADGTAFAASVTAGPVPHGGKQTILAVVRDLSERERLEAKARNESARAASLARFARRLNAQFEPRSLLNVICEEAAQALAVTAAGVSLYDEATEEFYLAADSGPSPERFRPRGRLPRSTHDDYVRRLGPTFVVPSEACFAATAADVVPEEWGPPATAVADLVWDGRLLGVLSVARAGEALSFDHDDLLLLRSLADYAGLALAAINSRDELRRLEARVSALLETIVSAQEEERRRAFAQVHDGIGHPLATAMRLLDDVSRSSELPEAVLGRVRAVSRLVGGAYAETRATGDSLLPGTLAAVGLEAALRQDLLELQARLGWRADLQADRLRLPQAIEVILYRVAGEIIRAAAALAGVETVAMRLRQLGRQVSLQVSINGPGFGFPVSGDAVDAGHLGFTSLRRRIELLGGSLKVEERPGEGTLVRAVVPLPEATATSPATGQSSPLHPPAAFASPAGTAREGSPRLMGTSPATLATLTPRENEVLRLMVEGLANKEIAGRLHTAEATVKKQVQSILAKLGAADRTQAVVTALRSGLT